VALSAYVPGNYPLDKLEPGLEETTFYDPPNFAFPNGVFVCEVEIDQETGHVRVDRLVGVHDAGPVINPMIVEGQIHGGVAQAVGRVLMEQAAYDPSNGQLLSGSYMDYCLPHAGDLPAFELAPNGVPRSHNPLGVKGAGEAGATAAPAAVIDAFGPLGVSSIDMPATSGKVWRIIREGGPAGPSGAASDPPAGQASRSSTKERSDADAAVPSAGAAPADVRQVRAWRAPGGGATWILSRARGRQRRWREAGG